MPRITDVLLARAFLVAVALHAAVTAAWGLPSTKVRLVPCPVRTVTGVACPGCGMTRSCNAVARGRFAEAWKLNPLSFALLSLAALVATAPGRVQGAWRRLPVAGRHWLLWAAFLATAASWLLRL